MGNRYPFPIPRYPLLRTLALESESSDAEEEKEPAPTAEELLGKILEELQKK